jgi:ABC-type transport system substrate-binding protein
VEAGADFGARPVGTGAFRFLRWEPGTEIVLERNPDYFAGPAHLDRIVYRIQAGRSDDALLDAFTAGELHHVTLSGQPGRLKEIAARYAVRRRPLLAVRFYGFQLQRREWRERRVRTALVGALDGSALAPSSMGGGIATRGIMPPGLPGYRPAPPPPAPDIDQASRLLAEAGHPRGAGLPPVAVWISSRTSVADAEIGEMTRAWTQLGLTVTTAISGDWPAFVEALGKRQAPLFRYVWYADIPDPDNILGVLFHSRSPYNYTGYADPEVDRLLVQARREMNPVARAESYVDIERRILADVPVIPIAHPRFEVAYQPHVHGVDVTALGAPYIAMRRVWLDAGGVALTSPPRRR